MTIIPNKQYVIDRLNDMDDVSDELRLCVELKVALLADDKENGGLNETSRRRAWDMVRDLTNLIRARPENKDAGK